MLDHRCSQDLSLADCVVGKIDHEIEHVVGLRDAAGHD
jgi:hypothetical protein